MVGALDDPKHPLQPVAKTAADLGISDSCLRNWIARAAVEAGERPGVTSDEGRELVELRRRNRVLETENEILKRAAAYFARENVLPKQSTPSSADAATTCPSQRAG